MFDVYLKLIQVKSVALPLFLHSLFIFLKFKWKIFFFEAKNNILEISDKCSCSKDLYSAGWDRHSEPGQELLNSSNRAEWIVCFVVGVSCCPN